MTNTKQVVQDVLDKLPDDCSIADVQYQLYVVDTLRRRLEQADQGDFVSHEEVKQRMEKWLKK
jgi:predicted transcriptional regulator